MDHVRYCAKAKEAEQYPILHPCDLPEEHQRLNMLEYIFSGGSETTNHLVAADGVLRVQLPSWP
jgi:hypothetical protein